MNIKSAEERLKEYQPLWENWVVDSIIHNGVNSRVYKIKRNRDGEDEFSVMKVVTITLESDMLVSKSEGIKYLDDRCAKAKAEIRNMIKLQRSSYIVSYYDDAVKVIYDDNGEKAGYDLLIRMEYLECFGTKIRNSDQKITTGDIINLAYDIGYALRDVHKCNMIHRDIKPDNIFVDEYGYYKLGDFGVTKTINATGYTSTRTGTEPYAAPEVWRSENNSENAYAFKADIYSFGLVLYQLINNNLLPFMADFTHNEVERSVLLRMKGEKIPLPSGGNPELKRIVCRMCEFNPDDRYRNMNEFLKDLEKAGKRTEDTGDDFNELSGSIEQDLIDTLDANEGFEYNDVEETPAPAGQMPGVAPAYPIPEVANKAPSVSDLTASDSESEVVNEETCEESEPQAEETVEESEPQAEETVEESESQAEETVEESEPQAEEIIEKTEIPEAVVVTESDLQTENTAEEIKPSEVIEKSETEAIVPVDVETSVPVVAENNKSVVPEVSAVDDEFHTIPPAYNKNIISDEWHTHIQQVPPVQKEKTVDTTEVKAHSKRTFNIPADQTFKNKDYRTVMVRNGELNIPNGYRTVDFFTVYGIERSLIQHITIPESVTQISEGAFRDMKNLKSVDINGNVMTIQKELFSGCSSLESIVIPESVKRIGDFVFEGCSALKTIEIRGNVSGIGKNAFTGCNPVVRCFENSFVHSYCIKYNIATEYIN